MQVVRDNYFTAYRSPSLTREADGVLVVQFHTDCGPRTFPAPHHTEVVDAFHRIAQVGANKIVILSGAGGDFIIGVDRSSFDDAADPIVWSQIHDEGTQVLENTALNRARELAGMCLKAPEVTRRDTRIHFIQPLKKRIVREVGYGLSLEGASSTALAGSKQAKSEPAGEKRKSV